MTESLSQRDNKGAQLLFILDLHLCFNKSLQLFPVLLEICKEMRMDQDFCTETYSPNNTEPLQLDSFQLAFGNHSLGAAPALCGNSVVRLLSQSSDLPTSSMFTQACKPLRREKSDNGLLRLDVQSVTVLNQ